MNISTFGEYLSQVKPGIHITMMLAVLLIIIFAICTSVILDNT